MYDAQRQLDAAQRQPLHKTCSSTSDEYVEAFGSVVFGVFNAPSLAERESYDFVEQK
jgi:hypothetical protein